MYWVDCDCGGGVVFCGYVVCVVCVVGVVGGDCVGVDFGWGVDDGVVG